MEVSARRSATLPGRPLRAGGVYRRSSPCSLALQSPRSWLLVPWTRTSTGQRSFASFGPTPQDLEPTTNCLPTALQSPELSLASFKRQLKTHPAVPALYSAVCSCGCRVPSSVLSALLWLYSVFGADSRLDTYVCLSLFMCASCLSVRNTHRIRSRQQLHGSASAAYWTSVQKQTHLVTRMCSLFLKPFTVHGSRNCRCPICSTSWSPAHWRSHVSKSVLVLFFL